MNPVVEKVYAVVPAHGAAPGPHCAAVVNQAFAVANVAVTLYVAYGAVKVSTPPRLTSDASTPLKEAAVAGA